MISFPTPTPPSCLLAFSLQNPTPSFHGNKSLPFQDCKVETRAQLLANQHYQCAYCETPLSDHGESTHLDHMEPQGDCGGNPSRRFDITNLVAACQTAHTCGHKHGNNTIPDELNPYLASDLHTAFECNSAGELTAVALPESTASVAMTQLNLNDPGLQSERSTIIAKLRQYTIALGVGARKKIKSLATTDTGFISLHIQELGKFGFKAP